MGQGLRFKARVFKKIQVPEKLMWQPGGLPHDWRQNR